MKLFGWTVAREARPGLARGTLVGSPAAWPASYEVQVREGYARNAVAQRAVKLVAQGVAEVPIDGPDAALALLRPQGGAPGVLESVAAQLLLHGNAFVQVMGDAGVARLLYPLRPERVSVEQDALGWPAAYRYRVTGRETRLTAEAPRPQVIHIRGFNPVDDLYGMGCLGAAAGPIAVHNAAAQWNKALLDNAARPSGALVYDPGDGSSLSPEQFERLKREMEAGFAGSGNAGRPMLLEGGLKWQALSLSPADMDFVGLKAAAAREIATAFGVPPMLLGLPGDATYANYKEAGKALFRQTVLPLANAVLAALGEGLAGWLGEAVTLTVDLDRVPVLAEERERLWRLVSAADFITRDEKRQMVGWSQ